MRWRLSKVQAKPVTWPCAGKTRSRRSVGTSSTTIESSAHSPSISTTLARALSSGLNAIRQKPANVPSSPDSASTGGAPNHSSNERVPPASLSALNSRVPWLSGRQASLTLFVRDDNPVRIVNSQSCTRGSGPPQHADAKYRPESDQARQRGAFEDSLNPTDLLSRRSNA